MNEVIAVAYGGGTNSTAMLVGMKNKGIRPDYITFADTGAEKPHTYEHIKVMQEWLESVGFPPIITVHKVDKNGDRLTLEQNCLKKKMLPSIAYGFKTCSKKYKIQPQDKYFNNLPETKKVFKEGGKITKYIGYDADEPHRAKIMDDKKYRYKYPLIEWGWGRDECIEAIKAEGLPLPHKSACFFCPASKQYEIKNLKLIYPDLADRAIQMEENADLHTIKGLGRNFSWKNALATDDMFENNIEIDCGCYDG